MEVKLAGYNVDVDSIQDLKRLADMVRSELSQIKLKADSAGIDLIDLDGEHSKTNLADFSEVNKTLCHLSDMKNILDNMTPETIAASYARISRDPRSIPELRADARKDVEGSRKSNRTIIFTMGHKSIAEHAVFNIDIMGLSRKAVESLEEKRLCSYTEKSQRYITLEGDYVMPREITANALQSEFRDLVERIQNKFYFDNLKALQEWHAKQDYAEMFSEMGIKDEKKKAETIELLGKEDARYALSMATKTQLGETISARNLEVLITRLRSSHSSEEQELGERLFSLVDGIAPSLIKYTEPTNYFTETRPFIRRFVEDIIIRKKFSESSVTGCSVNSYPGYDRDTSILAGLIFGSSNLSYQDSLRLFGCMTKREKVDLRDATLLYKQVHDPMLREYELGDRVAELVVSSSVFAQLKRHRMDTIIAQDYDTRLGVTVPPSIAGIGKEEEFVEVMHDSEELYRELKKYPNTAPIAEYVLTNAHRRRVLLDANNRQVYALAAERQNIFAQWDIRKTVKLYVQAMKEGCPLTLEAACGKHEHDLVVGGLLSN